MGARIAVIGAHGMLGHMVVRVARRAGHEVLCFRMHTFCETDETAIRSVDFAINCAGYLGTDATDLRSAIRGNVLFARHLASVAPRLLHISTDGVFSGNEGPYDEERLPDAQSLYGVTKALGEPPDAMSLRTSIVGPDPYGGRHLFETLRRAPVFRAFRNQLWNGVTTLALAQALIRIIDENLFERGVFHIFSDDQTKLDLVLLLVKCFKFSTNVVEEDAEYSRDLRLRTNRKLLQELAIPSFKEQVDSLVRLWSPGRPIGDPYHGEI